MPSPSNLDPDWTKQKVVKEDGRWMIEGRPGISVSVSWHETPSNVPGKASLGLLVTQPVGSATPPHTHNGAAVAATVLRGKVVNQMVCADGHVIGPLVYEAGESWYEAPGCHHVRSENAGDEESQFIASFIIDQAQIDEKGILGAAVIFDGDAEK